MTQGKGGQAQKQKIESLQALRALAFFGIFLAHAGSPAAWPNFGVSVFFVLSGFLLVYRGAETGKATPGRALRFACKRVGRLYPLHLLTMVLAMALPVGSMIRHGVEAEAVRNLLLQVICNLFLVQTFVPTVSMSSSLNSVAWYLSVSLFLYFCFPFLKAGLKKIKSGVALAGLALLFLALQLGFAGVALHIPGPDGSFYLWATYFCPVFRLGDFTVGCLCAKAVLDKKLPDREEKSRYDTPVEFAAVLLTIAVFWLMNQTGKDFGVLQNLTTVYVPLAAVYVLLFYRQGGVLTRLCTGKWLVRLGDLSGPAFLIHFVVTQYTRAAFLLIGTEPRGVGKAVSVLAQLLLTVICSMAYRQVEKKWTRLRKLS